MICWRTLYPYDDPNELNLAGLSDVIKRSIHIISSRDMKKDLIIPSPKTHIKPWPVEDVWKIFKHFWILGSPKLTILFINKIGKMKMCLITKDEKLAIN